MSSDVTPPMLRRRFSARLSQATYRNSHKVSPLARERSVTQQFIHLLNRPPLSGELMNNVA